ncbi:hypothetical protein BDW74DRAFT_181048 [Aspergillus multicolor]|uniref:uncharacterized protein n=1 Tax=Aspergillus multicolor TaxID=41759 RepID=UPI003CCD1208
MKLLSTLALSLSICFASPVLSQDDTDPDPEPTPSTTGTIQAYAQDDWSSYPDATAAGCLDATGRLDFSDPPSCVTLENSDGFISTEDGDFLRILPDGRILSIEEPSDYEVTRCTEIGENSEGVPSTFLTCTTSTFNEDYEVEEEFDSGPSWYPVSGSYADDTIQLTGNGTDFGAVLGLVFVPVDYTADDIVV